MKKALLLVLLVAALCITAIPAAAADGHIATFTLDGSTTYSTVSVTDGSVKLLNTPATVSGFCGWEAVINGKTVFLPAGATCTGITGNVTFKAVTASFVTDTGASVRIRKDDVGLRFTSTIAKSDYQKIISLAGGGDKVQFGTYIVPSRYVTDAHGNFTLVALEKTGYEMYIDVPTKGFYKETDTAATIAGSVSQIKKGNYTMEYTGRGYMKITYTDGTVGTFYADYNQTDNARSIVKTVLAAYNDRDESYGNLIVEDTGSTHSPYTNTEMKMMRNFLDRVVFVGHDMSYNYFVLSTGYYKSPWKITHTSDQYGRSSIYAEPLSGLSPEDVMGVYLDGLSISMAHTTIESGKFVFKHDTYIQVN